jgi:DNA-binding XRE family transcriptional regulator
MGFKERLKEKRVEANLTQVELAKKAGVTARTIQNYELGNRKPVHMDVVQKMQMLSEQPHNTCCQQRSYVADAYKRGAKAAEILTSCR